MTSSPSPDAAGRDNVIELRRLGSIETSQLFSQRQILNSSADEIQSLRAQLAEKEKDEGQLVDKYTYQVSSLQESLREAGKRIFALAQQLEAIRKQTVKVLTCAKTALILAESYCGGEALEHVSFAIKFTGQVLSSFPTTAEEESNSIPVMADASTREDEEPISYGVITSATKDGERR